MGKSSKHYDGQSLPASTAELVNGAPGNASDLDSPNEKSVLESGSVQDQGEEQKLHLPLVLTLAGAAFLNTLAVQSTVIILPSISHDLGIPAERQQWVISAYYLTFGCFLLLWGRLADLFGRRLVFLVGSVWLTVATIVVPFAPHEIVLDLFRGFQGLGAAANVPTAIGILGAKFRPGKQKNYAFAIYSAGSSCGSVLGNIFSGVIAQFVSWKWIFWISAVFCGIITLAGYFLIPYDDEKVEEVATTLAASSSSPVPSILLNVDWLGGTLVSGGLLLLLFTLTQGNVVGWSNFWVPLLLVLSVALLVLFALWIWYLETRTKRPPLMRISIFYNARFNAAQVIMASFFAAFNNYLVHATYFYQDYQGLGPLETAIRFIPTGIMGILGNVVAAVLLSRVPGSHLLVFSCACVSISCLLMAVPIPPSVSYWAYGFPAMMLSTLGADILHPTLNLFTVQSLPPDDQALGAAVITAALQIGRAIGITVATVIQTSVEGAAASARHEDPLYALLQGLHAAQWFNFSLAVASCIVVLLFFRGREKVGAVKK
ncbi:drug resistance protein [Rhypophila decipiens]|uniref:Drug resistance protein n=1 Tax=Rhypophila decipiens TaxID=261697 RepID=A0AAN6XZ26_9PEZI|nr:drug resistance protein [Rhypophila decipiens]